MVNRLKKVLIKLIKFYQKIPGNFHYQCKFYPTCSNYSIDAISEYGATKGVLLGIYRILRCNPFNKGGYDPVKKKELKK